MSFWTTREPPPFNKLLGIEVAESRPGYVELAVSVKPEHCNHLGIPHGGFIATLMDVACGMAGLVAASAAETRPAVTLSLTVNYLAQAQSADLKAIGRISRTGGSIYFSNAELFDAGGTLLATASGTFSYRDRKTPP